MNQVSSYLPAWGGNFIYNNRAVSKYSQKSGLEDRDALAGLNWPQK